jgi:hypothetical protein
MRSSATAPAYETGRFGPVSSSWFLTATPYNRIRSLRLTAVNADAVALTQATPGSEGLAQPVDVMSRSATVTRAWKVDVDRLPVFRSTML